MLIYPIFELGGSLFFNIRKNIENFLIFQPSRLRAKKIQRDLLKQITPQYFVNADGIRLYSWFIKPKGNMPVILHLHGQAESILSHQDVAAFCLTKGFGALMLSYRGHYKSGGKASEKGVYNDAKAAIVHLKKLGIDEDKVIIWGHSLGTSVAVETATKTNVSGIVLQSPIKDVKSAAIDVYKFYCDRMNLGALSNIFARHISHLNLIQKMDNVNKIHKVKCPILIVHSKTDKIAPWRNAVELSDNNENAQLYISETGSHWDAEWCFDRISNFIETTATCHNL